MAAQKEVTTYIKLFGKVDSSFNELSRKFQNFGNTVSSVGGALTMITAPIAAAAKQSIDLYTDYDDVMRRIQAVGGYTEDQMQVISDAARQAGADTRYMALDAGNAFLYLTQAGIDMNGSLDVMPSLLNAAAAGNMELADASDLLISNIYSLGKEFDNLDVSEYIDQVSTAADSTNTNLQEMMEGVSKVGAAGRMFGGGTEELLAFMGMLANLNLKGSTGGINARNMIISLLAPTEKAGKLMDALAISEEEMGEALQDVDLDGSAKIIKRLGLETVDATGKVRPVIDILTDLKSSLSDMNDDEVANVLYTIFGKRTYPAVAGLMDMLDDYPELLQTIMNSSGAAERKAETLESGIGGSTRRLKSALQELGLSAGEVMNDKVIDWMDSARDITLNIADAIEEMDPATVDAIMDAFLGIAVAGPGMLIAGKAISGVGAAIKLLGTPGGKIMALAFAIGALNTAYNAWDNAQTQKFLGEHFGSLEFNSAQAQAIIASLSSEFETKAASLTTYTEAITGASEAYESAVNALSGGLLEAYFAQTDLTELDKQDLLTLAGNMAAYLQEAMEQEKIYLGDLIDLTFDGTSTGDTEKNSAWDSLVTGVFGELEKEAADASEELRAAMVEALKDGELSEDELEAIRATQGRMNMIMAEIAAINGEYDANLAYNKAMYMSYDSLEEQMAALDEAEKAAEAATSERLASLAALIDTAEQMGIELPKEFQDAYGITATDYAGARSGLQADWANQIIDNRIKRDEYGARITSEYFNPFNNELDPFYSLFDAAAKGDQTSIMDAIGMYNGTFDTDESQRFGKSVLGTALDHFSFEDLTADMERQIEKQGFISQDLFNTYRDYIAGSLYGSLGSAAIWDQSDKALLGDGQFVTINGQQLGTLEDLQRYAFYANQPPITIPAEVELTGEEEVVEELSTLGDDVETIEASVTVDDQGLTVDSLDGQSVEVDAELSPDGYTAAEIYAEEFNEGMEEAETEIEVDQPDGVSNGSTYAGNFQTGINRKKPKITVTQPDGLLDGTTYAEAFQGALNAHEFTIEATISNSSDDKKEKFAAGGRAVVPSIFGEDGPEWAIPEEHSQRTAELLASAARASGFTADEIAARTGGLNGNTSVAPQFIFAPRIYANSGSDVKAALDKAKVEFEEWYEEQKRRMERMSYQ